MKPKEARLSIIKAITPGTFPESGRYIQIK
jgi:hypothetical protein